MTKLMADDEAKRADSERHAASVERDLANVREELRDLAARPVALEEAQREVAALTRDLQAARRASTRLESSQSALCVRVKVIEAELTAADARAEESSVMERHKGKRRAERLQAEVERLTTVNAGLISRLQVAEDRSGIARRAMLDHAART
jgi:chromosome segregation ATPase